jgi:hypothetical protein
MSPPAQASCNCLGPGECSLVMREPSSLTVVAEYFFIHLPWAVGYATAPEPSTQGGGVWHRGTHGGSEALLVERWGPEPRDVWQLRSPLSREAGSGAALRPQSCPAQGVGSRAYMRGYLVHKVLTVAPGSSSGEVVNLQVGPNLLHQHSASRIVRFCLRLGGNSPLVRRAVVHILADEVL